MDRPRSGTRWRRTTPLYTQILPLRGAIRHYEWGSRTALGELLGRSVPSEQPEAELWLGAHPSAPAEVCLAGRWEPLDRLLARAGPALLGSIGVPGEPPRMPFLLKVLAVERPLSLQAHPDAARAREAFARGAADGAASPYADGHGKPELVCALTPFAALCGFAPLAEVRARFHALGLGALVPAGDEAAVVLSGLLRAWLGASPAARAPRLAAALERARQAAARDPVYGRVCALAELHPGDPAVLAPLFLHEVRLEPGEALFLAPGVPHAYLSGLAVELMASSDNVVRGGLTRKPVDVAELLRILRFDCTPPERLRARPRAPGEGVWPTPAREFELSELRPAPDTPVVISRRVGIELLWCAAGELLVQAAHGAGLVLRRGESCLVPAAAGTYRVAGTGRAFRAAISSGDAPSAGALAPGALGGERRPGERACGS